MHIKQITISNFRSFRQQPEIHPFAPTTNCIVGRNGSGKSNLFDAIQFVLLSPRFATLRTEERQSLLHEGSGSAAVNAFVEVVFDNSDNRFSLENSDEVVLRRTVGAKKDEFFLQRKRATKQEVQSLLEGAGFSKSNPYFMVQQGKIQTLCLMTDSQRLALLQEVAGTTLYEDKKAESLVKMTENSHSIEKINAILEDIDQRLGELKGEKEELSIYQEHDRTRKALEYTLYDKELRKARHVLDHLEHERSEHLQATAALHEVAKDTHDRIQSAEQHLKIQNQALRRTIAQLQNLEEDKTRAVTLRTKLDLQCKELQEQIQLGEESLANTESELRELDDRIATAERQVEEKDAILRARHVVLNGLLQEKDSVTRKADSIYAKQGRGQDYNSKADRDRSLHQQIIELETLRREKQEYLDQQQATLGTLRRSTREFEKEIALKSEELARKTEALQVLQGTLEEKSRYHHKLIDGRKLLWREAESLHQRAKEARETYQQSVGEFRKSMPRATAMGIGALPRVVEEEGLLHGHQYFGMVIDNMDLKDPKFQTAVEAATQNSLFHVIVDTDATAARIMNRLERERLGRLTFMPLNQIRTDSAFQYPTSKDVASMLETCVKYDPRVSKAMQHVFHKKTLARTVEIASEWAEKLQMDCITLEGDICSRKGALTGGYVDIRKSRLRAHSAKAQAEEAFRCFDREFREADARAKEAEQDVTNAGQQVAQLQNQKSQQARYVCGVEAEIAECKTQLVSNKRQVERIESQVIPPVERELAAIIGEIDRLEEETGSELTSSLNETERAELARLNDHAKALQTQISEKSEAVEIARTERQHLLSLLEDNLLKRRREMTKVYPEDENLLAPTSKLLHRQKKRELEDLLEQLLRAGQNVADVDKQLQDHRRSEDEIKGELRNAKQDLDKLKGQDMKNSKLLDESSEVSEKLMSKKSMNAAKRDSYMRKIQELGSLPPPSELKNYESKTITELEKELDRINSRLKKYSHVNKKAFDQYVNFSEQRESLIKRKEELDKGEEKVRELVESLDRKKDEAINRTFRGVRKHFADVFKELVPLGAGELIIRTASDEKPDGTDDELDSEGDELTGKRLPTTFDPDVSLYRGIGVKVRFSAAGENFMMSQLSGGQKALVALALIFSIQRCDPAPFYIFDELDQALDSTYRQAVASLIQRQANSEENPTQFITSTFRPELVAIARNCYGMSHQNKVSSIHHMSKNDALKFIANLMSEEEAVGEITNVKSNDSRRDSSRKRKAPYTADENATARTSNPAGTSEEGAMT